jgi:hypothetical protein
MPCQSLACIRQVEFDRIAYYARRRYIEGVSTIVLLCAAESESEKTLIVLASLLDLEDENIRELKPYCSHQCQRLMFDLRDRLKSMIEQECSVT